jgi:hypothetical protein
MGTFLLYTILFLCALIGTACALVPFLKYQNDMINKKFEED